MQKIKIKICFIRLSTPIKIQILMRMMSTRIGLSLNHKKKTRIRQKRRTKKQKFQTWPKPTGVTQKRKRTAEIKAERRKWMHANCVRPRVQFSRINLRSTSQKEKSSSPLRRSMIDSIFYLILRPSSFVIFICIMKSSRMQRESGTDFL